VVKKYGRLKVLDDRELVVEIERAESFDALQQALIDAFHGEVDIELVKKRQES
jgi:hypothetical protein